MMWPLLPKSVDTPDLKHVFEDCPLETSRAQRALSSLPLSHVLRYANDSKIWGTWSPGMCFFPNIRHLSIQPPALPNGWAAQSAQKQLSNQYRTKLSWLTCLSSRQEDIFFSNRPRSWPLCKSLAAACSATCVLLSPTEMSGCVWVGRASINHVSKWLSELGSNIPCKWLLRACHSQGFA